MPEVRVFKPTTTAINPRHAKPWTQKQAASRKDQAEDYVRQVLEDDERADEIADMSPEEYAAERRKEVIENSKRSRSMKRRSSAAQGDDSPALQTNAKLSVANGRLADQLADKQKEIDKLQARNAALQSRLDEVNDIVTCTDPECTAEEHIDEIQDVVAGGGGNGNGHDDDDD